MATGKALGEAGWWIGWLGQDFCFGGITFKAPVRQPGRGVGTAGGRVAWGSGRDLEKPRDVKEAGSSQVAQVLHAVTHLEERGAQDSRVGEEGRLWRRRHRPARWRQAWRGAS